MDARVKQYINLIEDTLNDVNAKITLILIGGLAMSFYGQSRYTLDIDAEISCPEEVYYRFIEKLKNKNIAFNISENISGWGIIPLPEGYRERAREVYKSKYLCLKILDPLDFIFCKLRRGTEEDFSDIMFVVKKYRITKNDIKEREKLIVYPRDPETLFFKKKLEHLYELMKDETPA